MVNTPFFMSPAQQVLVKGVQMTTDNLEEIINFVVEQFNLLEGKIADVSAMVHDQNEFQKVSHFYFQVFLINSLIGENNLNFFFRGFQFRMNL